MLTTRPPDVDVAGLFPELAGREQVTVRLHPRKGAEPAPGATKLGGRMDWPPVRPWPHCDLPHTGYDANEVPPWRTLDPDGRPFVAVLQVRRDDVPELGFPDRADTFQLLWCPASHPELYAPAIRVFWHAAASLGSFIPPAPYPRLDADVYIPEPCVLKPEQVTEYPGFGELDQDLANRIGAWESAEGSPRYQWALSSAPGTKVGGYPFWFQDPEPQTCLAGHPMDHLLTISDTEFDGGTWQRWLPVEEEGVWHGPTTARFAAQEAAGLHFGMGSIYVFMCRSCESWPIRQVYQR